ncbi:MAG: hypothetical protein ACRETA_06150 [Gammaproteobacteria bacterium]
MGNPHWPPGGHSNARRIIKNCVKKRLDQLVIYEKIIAKIQKEMKHQIKQAKDELKSIEQK